MHWSFRVRPNLFAMPLTSLDSFSLAQVTDFLDFDHIARLWACGSLALNAHLRSRVKSFRLTLPSVGHPCSLADLFRSFASICAKPQSFSLKSDVAEPELDTQYLWNLLPHDLKQLSLPLFLNSLTSELFTAFPTLESLSLRGLHSHCDPALMPSTLTSLTLGEKGDVQLGRGSNFARDLLANLPPQIETLVLRFNVEHDLTVPLSLRHLPLRKVYIKRLYATVPVEWTFLPPSVTDLHICIQREFATYGEHYLKPPSSWSALFPELVHLATNYESLCLHRTTGDFSYDLPPSFTSLKSIGFGMFQGMPAAEFFKEKFLGLFGHSIRRLRHFPVSIELAMKYIPHITEIDLCKSRYSAHANGSLASSAIAPPSLMAPSSTKSLLPTSSGEPLPPLSEMLDFLHGMKSLTSLTLDWLPTPAQIRFLPRSLTDVRLDLRFEKLQPADSSLLASSHSLSSSPGAVTPSDWPPNITHFDLVFRYYTLEEGPARFDLRILPSTIVKLEISPTKHLSDDYEPEDDYLGASSSDDEEGADERLQRRPALPLARYPYVIGDVAHMTHLEALRFNGVSFADSPEEQQSPYAFFLTHLELPPSLTKLTHPRRNGFPDSIINDAHDATSGTHYFKHMKHLDLGLVGERYRGASIGTSTEIFRHLPPHLETLELTCDPKSPGWTISLMKALPRSLEQLHLNNLFLIKFDDDPSLVLKGLPSRLVSLSLMGSGGSEEYDNAKLYSAHLPYVRTVQCRFDLLKFSARQRQHKEDEVALWMARWNIHSNIKSAERSKFETPKNSSLRVRKPGILPPEGRIAHIVSRAPDGSQPDAEPPKVLHGGARNSFMPKEEERLPLVPSFGSSLSPDLLLASIPAPSLPPQPLVAPISTPTPPKSDSPAAPAVPANPAAPKPDEEPPVAFAASFLTSSPFYNRAPSASSDDEKDDWD